MYIVWGFLILIITMLSGVAVPFAFGLFLIIVVFWGGYDPSFLIPYGYSKIAVSTLLAIPLFILAGGFMYRGGIGTKLVDLVDLAAGRIRGGFGVVATVSCALFGAVTGSAAATLYCIGSIMFPRMEQMGYPRGHSASLMASACVLGMLIPPSGLMILYGWVGGQSVIAAFLAGVAPGILLTILLSIINLWLLRNNPDVKTPPPLPEGRKLPELGLRLFRAGPALLMPVIILGGIYGGVMTPTEAAAVAAVYAVPVGLWIYKGLTLKGMKEELLEAGVSTGCIMVMSFAMMALTRILIMEDLPGMILKILTGVSESKIVILLMVNIFLILIGMMTESISGILLATPILLPMMLKIGVHPTHFAAILAVNLGMGLITPPAAPLLYIAARIANARLEDMIRPTAYFILYGWLPTLAVTTYWPEFSLWLPRLILGIR